ncbi:acyl-coenzyme A synthetase ACSM3, mitochondrial-like isoform X2 [Penaeus japonicus]|uniref:acyl-coenzyme A synthetase ACSM3, mitochondrial-like isoform X2 n=1 Tax=Penaeus japonicus TaxID=27405 RepID=UPI001C714E99|nr:acyl-coenzyme A synthetase ACSM3, mitochondrial-like isoform X2 [Penaeus japonicus]
MAGVASLRRHWRQASLARSLVCAFKGIHRCQGGLYVPFPVTVRYGSSASNSISGYDAVRDQLQRDLKAPKFFNFAQDVVGAWASKKPTHPALHFVGDTKEVKVNYSDLYTEAIALATALSNPSPPKCALVLLPKIPEWWVVNVAGSWCGTIISPGTSLLTPADVAHRLQESNADCIICNTDIAARMNDVSKNVPLKIVIANEGADIIPGWISYNDILKSVEGKAKLSCIKSRGEDIAQLFFTSGTTGKPKMVTHTQASYGIGHKVTAKYWLDLNEDDLIWNISDTGWAKAAWSSLYTPFLAGATAFIHQKARFDAEEVLRILNKYPVSVLCAPPTAYRAMVQCGLEQYPFHSLRHCVSAGEPLNPEIMETWTKITGLRIYEGYGQTETTLLCSMHRSIDFRPGSMGKPAPGYNLKVINDDLNELGPHEEGYLAISLKEGKPIGLFNGYLASKEKTSKVFLGNYYITGDRAYYDENNYFWFVSRADDVIISSGYRIGPFEVESVLIEHPAVVESAVVSSPDSLRGEVVKAFVILADSYKNHKHEDLIVELQNHVKHNTAPYKYPRKIEFVDTLPKTISGKIRRVELRNNEWAKA